MIGSGIGLLKIPYFSEPTGLRFAKALDVAIQDLKDQGCRGLVIDLRGNIGGGLGFARLASYLCAGKIPIGYSLTPARLRRGYDRTALPEVVMPVGKIELMRTLARYAVRDKSVVLLTQGLGVQPFHGNVVVLFNEWTSSAGEMVASFTAENGLATTIGTTTAGKVLGAINFPLGGGYSIRQPVFGWYTSKGQCLEGSGIEPQIRMEPELDALSASVDSQLHASLNNLSDAAINPDRIEAAKPLTT
jgi:C-terminal processing protease CtpA/Prc